MTARLTLGAAAARALESGALRSVAARALAGVWAGRAKPTRPVLLPRGAAVIGVGGATLGGSYKTPLVLALARALTLGGERVAVAAHGYGRLVWPAGAARRVVPSDSARAVGDDALWLARALADLDVPVLVGPDRTEVLHAAAGLAPLVLADGLLQATPERLALSVLALGAAHPWGAGSCPPSGDLRASRASLLAATDVVVRVVCDGDALVAAPLDVGPLPALDAPSALALATATDASRRARPVSLQSLAGRRVGVVLAIARPDRVLVSLAAHGVAPAEVRLFRDHASPRRLLVGPLLLPSRLPQVGPLGQVGRSAAVDVWLTTSKCATKLGAAYEGRPLLVLDHRVTAPPELLAMVRASIGARLRGAAGGATRAARAPDVRVAPGSDPTEK